jgi:hypothetical protein
MGYKYVDNEGKCPLYFLVDDRYSQGDIEAKYWSYAFAQLFNECEERWDVVKRMIIRN